MALRRVRYVGPSTSGVVIEHPPERWIEVAQGGHVDLPSRLAESLAEQPDNWELADTRKAAKADSNDGAAEAADVEGDG